MSIHEYNILDKEEKQEGRYGALHRPTESGVSVEPKVRSGGLVTRESSIASRHLSFLIFRNAAIYMKYYIVGTLGGLGSRSDL